MLRVIERSYIMVIAWIIQCVRFIYAILRSLGCNLLSFFLCCLSYVLRMLMSREAYTVHSWPPLAGCFHGLVRWGGLMHCMA